MSYKKTEQEYGIIFGKKPDSKDLRDPKVFTELYMRKITSDEDVKELCAKEREFERQGYVIAAANITVYGNFEPEDTLEVKVTKSYLKPSLKETLGCDFEI